MGKHEGSSPGAARILIVDDEEANVGLLERILRRAGYTQIESTTDPRSVATLLAEFEPDIILLDLLMPHLDGFAVMDLLNAAVPSDHYLPVLVLTADITPDTRRRALAGGAKDFLLKPFDVDEVVLRIKNMLVTRRLHLQLRRENAELEEQVRLRTQELERALAAEREAARRLRDLDRLKNTWLTAVSHEVRTPLTSILGGAQTLEKRRTGLSQDDQDGLIRGVAVNARKLNRLLSDLLDIDGLARGTAEPVRTPTDVGALIEMVIDGSEMLGDHPIDVRADAGTADIDDSKVERIIQHLLVNAARHTPPGTPIWVRACLQDDGVLIIVEDDGPGVPEVLRSRIFEPFEHGERRVEHAPGVGVGLSLVSRFAQLHGGKAWVEERPGGGASFQVFLPAAHELVARSSGAPDIPIQDA